MNLKNKDKTSALNYDDRKLRQGYINLQQQRVEDLKELIDRQNKLLRNRLFIEKLPDKGEKILSFRNELKNELKKRENLCDSTCELLSSLTLNDLNIEDIEWNEGKFPMSKNLIDSDDDEIDPALNDNYKDPLKLIATHSGTLNGIRQQENSFKSEEKKLSYIDKMCKKYDDGILQKDRFKPNQLKENNQNLFDTSAAKLKERLGKNWEITQVTPPISNFKNTKAISLSESLKLQTEQAQKIKETERKQAADKLLLNINIKMGSKLPLKNIMEYRSILDDSDEEKSNNDDCEDTGNEDEN